MPHANAACKATAKPCLDLAAEVSGHADIWGQKEKSRQMERK